MFKSRRGTLILSRSHACYQQLQQLNLVVVVLYNIFQARDGAISRGLPSSSTSASVAVDRE